MAYRELELTLVSAQELKNVNLITRMDVYAVASISGDPLTRQCTAPDTYGGRNPCWNATLRFAVPPTAAAASAGASLHVLLRAERFLGDRDVGEVVVPLADILAGAPNPGPQPPQVASYQVRKVHRWEPRGVLNVSYRLGPVVAPVLERWATPEKPVYAPALEQWAAPEKPVYAPVGVPPHHPSAVSACPAPSPPAAVGRVAEHEAAAQKSPPVVMAYPVVVPQQASHPPAKPDGTYHATEHEEAEAPSPARAPAPVPRNERRNGGHGQAGTTHVYMGPQTQIIFAGAPTSTAGPATRTMSPGARSSNVVSPAPAPAAGKGDADGNCWASLHEAQGSYYSGSSGYASAADSMSMSMSMNMSSSPSASGKEEDRSMRPKLSVAPFSKPRQQAASSPASRSHRLMPAAAASPSSSRSSSSSSPLSPYYSSSSPSSAHSSTRRSPAYSSAHHHLPTTTTASPRPRAPEATDHGYGTNNAFRSTSDTEFHYTSNTFGGGGGGGAISSPLLLSSSPLVPTRSSVALR